MIVWNGDAHYGNLWRRRQKPCCRVKNGCMEWRQKKVWYGTALKQPTKNEYHRRPKAHGVNREGNQELATRARIVADWFSGSGNAHCLREPLADVAEPAKSVLGMSGGFRKVFSAYRSSARFVGERGTMTSMVACDGTRPAALRSPCCFRSTIGAMLGVFGWAGDGTSVRFLVTRNAQSHPVIDGEREVGELSQGLYVMGLNVAFLPHFGRRSYHARIPPCASWRGRLYIGCVVGVLRCRLPCRSLFARKHLSTTGPRAESGAFVSAY